MKKIFLSLLVVLLITISFSAAYGVSYRIISEEPDNINIPFGANFILAGKGMFESGFYYGVDANIKKFMTLNFFHLVYPFNLFLPDSDDFQTGTTKSDYQYSEMRAGLSFHLEDVSKKEYTRVVLYSTSIGYNLRRVRYINVPIIRRYIFALRGGFDYYKGNATINTSDDYPVSSKSIYAGLSWTSVKDYKVRVSGYGTRSGGYRLSFMADLIYMMDDAKIKQFGLDPSPIGFRGIFEFNFTILSMYMEVGKKPGFNGGQGYFSMGFGFRFSGLLDFLRPGKFSVSHRRQNNDDGDNERESD